jgi:hypothetical protein
MITFKSHADLNQLDRNDPAFRSVEDLVERLILESHNKFPHAASDADDHRV